ncbi:MAG: protein-L-isoaspartate O-methyltransferase, partial [Deltaproteobacteria bacterium]|nr:protein-L-isoaspartate O-methyltransferase [Deltaproteobacteria bacterium]
MRRTMVETQLVGRGIKQKEVLDAMAAVPRHLFVDQAIVSQAYNDYPLPIGEDQTISQPYMVALMTEALGLTGKERVLEIGTGSGYQTAVLSLLAYKVYSI